MNSLGTTTFTQIIPVSEIRKSIEKIPKDSGVYKQYIDKEGLKYLDGVYPITKETAINGTEVYLLYIGLAKDLLDRFKWHLGITNTSHKSILGGWLSTLRTSYMANHKEIQCLSEQNKLDEFMNEHIYIQYMVTKDFVAIEEQLIKENDLPLNIKGNSHSFVPINRSRRKAISERYNKENMNSVNSTATKTQSKSQPYRSNSMIEDKVLREYARKAGKEGIKNKSSFLRWFRDIERQSAAQNRLHKAWDERNSGA